MSPSNVAEALSENGFTFDPIIKVWKLTSQQQFLYNDGDEAENYLLDVINKTNDVSVNSEELANKIKDWSSLYHLTSKRSNLLRPFKQWFKNKRVLEIGCGCGAITRFLSEAGATVISVEGSERRANITRSRARDMENVTVICAPNDKIPDIGEFDAVLLIGVLEYARVFLGENGQHDLLTFCRKKLVSNGKLFVAIENQLGLKYLAGVQEDHIGQPMAGINNNYNSNSVVTFGRNQLKELLYNAEMLEIEEFLPYPDYKLPTVIVSPLGWQKYYHELSELVCENLYKDPQIPLEYTFSLEEATKTVWRNKLSADLSNSFLMVASLDESTIYDQNIATWYYTDPHQANNKTIIFEPLNGILKAGVIMQHSPEKPIDYSDFITGGTLWSKLIGIINRPNWLLTDITEWVKQWLVYLEKLQGIDLSHWTTELSLNSFDALPFNLFESNHESHFFDLEWNASKSPTLGYIVYRGIFHSLSRLTSVAYSVSINNYNIFNLTSEILKILYPDHPHDSCMKYLEKDIEFMRDNAFGDVSGLSNAFLNKKLSVRLGASLYHQKINELVLKQKELIYINDIKNSEITSHKTEFSEIIDSNQKIVTKLQKEIQLLSEKNSRLVSYNEEIKYRIESILKSRTWRFITRLSRITNFIMRYK